WQLKVVSDYKWNATFLAALFNLPKPRVHRDAMLRLRAGLGTANDRIAGRALNVRLSCAPVFEPNGAFHGITANTPHLYRDAINHWSLVLVEVKAAIGCHPYLRAIFALLVTTLRCLGPTTPIYVQRHSRDPDPLAPKALTLPQLRLVPGARG